MKVRFDTTQATRYASKLVRAVTKVRPDRTTKHYGTILLARTRAYASGRPGPNVITGRYRASIGVKHEFDRAESRAVAIVGSDAPQAARLEFGFKGVDSLGRHYNQPPFPHYRPALDDMERLFPNAAADAAMKWVPET